jgi:hypothetical protein
VAQIQTWLENPDIAFFPIFILLIIVYKLGFARGRLPLLKAALVYLLMAIGCFPLTMLHIFGMPIIPAMIAAIVLLILVRFREKASRSEREKADRGMR